MQALFILLTLLLLGVALFVLENPDAVTVRFWPWQFQASVAVVILGSTAVGALIAGLLSLAGRLRRWQPRPGASPPAAPDAALPPDLAPPSGPPARPQA